LEAAPQHDAASLARIQTDAVSLAARRVVAPMTELDPRDDRQREALASLGRWDGSLSEDSVDAAVFETWVSALMRRLVGTRLPDDVFAAYLGFRETFLCRVLPELLAHGSDRLDPQAMLDALDDALDETAGRTWGELHTLVLAHPLARIPGLDTTFTAASTPFGGDDQTIAQAGFDPLAGYRPAVIASIRAVYDLANLERSLSVLPTGISGNPASPHWADQHELYAAGGTKPAGMSTAAVATLTIRPS
jgi:penicillin amidase